MTRDEFIAYLEQQHRDAEAIAHKYSGGTVFVTRREPDGGIASAPLTPEEHAEKYSHAIAHANAAFERLQCARAWPDVTDEAELAVAMALDRGR